jgi:hypothetical protein
MKLDILTIIILVSYTYIMLCVLKTNELTEMSLLTLLLILYFYINNKNSKIEGYNLNDEYAPVGCNTLNCGHREHKVNHEDNSIENNIENSIENITENITDPVKGSFGTPDVAPKPIETNPNDKMSNFDGLCLKTGNVDSWMKSPSDIQLNSNEGLYTIQGGTAPVKPVFSDPTSLQGPPLDGNESSPHKLFMLANNKVSPDCCPSTFSTSTGCLCSTHQQREFIKHRGNNVSGCNLTY